jgi:mannonate dehydratase
MYIGEQLGDRTPLSEERLTSSAELGVNHLLVHALSRGEKDNAVLRLQDPGGAWDVAALQRLRRYVSGFGMSLEALHLELGTLHLDLAYGNNPERASAQLTKVRRNIRTAGEAGIPCLKYNLQVLGVLRTGWVSGRGGLRYEQFSVEQASKQALADYSVTVDADEAAPIDAAGLTEAQSWSAITTILEALLPVAEESGVDLACHPQDPALPAEGLHGVTHVLGSIEGMKKLLSISASPRNVFTFCQGTVAEMCRDPASDVLAAIQYFGTERRIRLVHFRNISGGYLDFAEVPPDVGAVDMYRALEAYQSVGYRGIFVPDHVPSSDTDPNGDRQHAFALGYMRALIQAVQANAASNGGVALRH